MQTRYQDFIIYHTYIFNQPKLCSQKKDKCGTGTIQGLVYSNINVGCFNDWLVYTEN